ncbi:hypothetical protein H4R34_000048 [Dimargaris verticillata]|uniref:NADH-ubiquinone oxidoreductase 14 kDa subunit n=1 Tax=Dimargaris verticillata TaxID=2761393 RepID=A0A9W8EFS5_9FUNG|nr:hypothetical protein H4R34_000048 [Dimargaris verticillata]
MAISYVLGGITVGFLGRMYSMGIMQRPFFQSVGGYAVYMTLGGLGGYWYHGFKEKQYIIHDLRYKAMLEHRQKREQQLADDKDL